MAYQQFHILFPQIAEREIRSATVFGRDGLPDAQYGFAEMYCTDSKCDCRRVIIQVICKQIPNTVLATLNYGWDTEQFYARFMNDKRFAKHAAGVTIEPSGPQSEYAGALKRLFEEILEDPEYVERLERHYTMVKRRAANPTVRRPKMRFRRK